MNKLFLSLLATASIFTSSLVSVPAFSAEPEKSDNLVYSAEEKHVLKTVRVTDNIYMIESKMGGNVTVAFDDKNAILIDDQLEGKSQEIKDAIKAITSRPVEFIINTHYHFDHTGGNVAFEADGAKIIAHENVYTSLKEGGSIKFFNAEFPPAPKSKLPVLTFDKSINLYVGDDVAKVIYVPDAHTNGDSFVKFEKANVIVSGDLFFNGRFPFIDVENGGSMRGMIAGLGEILKASDDKTKIISGHGDVGNRTQALEAKTMLIDFLTIVQENKAKTAEELMKNEKLAAWGKKYGWEIISYKQFIEIVLSDFNQQYVAKKK